MQSLTTRFLLAFLAVILITTFSAGVPAYIIIRTELEDQAWERVVNGGRISMSLLDSEKNRLENLAILVAQRPTLLELVLNSDIDRLNEYLRTFQEAVDLDILIVSDENNQVISKGTSVELFPSIISSLSQHVDFENVNVGGQQIAMIGKQFIPNNEGRQLSVIVGVILDNDFTENLASETGFEHSFLINGQISATSLDDILPTVPLLDVIQRVNTSGRIETARLDYQQSNFYISLLPLVNKDGKNIGFLQVILPVVNLDKANQTAILLLLGSTLFVAFIASGIAGYLSQRLTTPLKDLTNAALKITQGDYITPIPVPDGPKEITALANSFEDSRKTTFLALQNLDQSRKWFETVINSTVDGIVTIDDHGAVTLFNRGAENITGQKAIDVLGTSIDQVIQIQDNSENFLRTIRKSEGVQNVHIKTKSGEELTLAVTCAPMQSLRSGDEHTAIVLRDISQEEAVRRLRSFFLANISHEFRTPLTALNASVELLLEDLEELSLSEIAELLNSLHFSVTGLQTLIDNLLESTSIEAGHFHIYRRATDVSDVVTRALLINKPFFERRRQNVTCNIPAQLPLIMTDPTRLVQVLVNLLSNASKYSPMETAIELNIKIDNNATLSFAVSDRGYGIPASERSKLFRPFMRLEENDDSQLSMGLGLSVVKAIIEAHQGEVGMEEREDGGSIFWFSIPYKEAP